jgi:hypothetical protein
MILLHAFIIHRACFLPSRRHRGFTVWLQRIGALVVLMTAAAGGVQIAGQSRPGSSQHVPSSSVAGIMLKEALAAPYEIAARHLTYLM